MYWMLTIAVCWNALENPAFIAVKRLQPVPDHSEHFLQAPASVDVDGNGRYYLLDIVARTVFVWNEDGGYQGTIGGPGEGPGEFLINGMGGPQGYLAVVDGMLRIYDGGKRAVHYFDLAGTFRKTTRFRLDGGRTEGFYFTEEGGYILHYNFFHKEPETFEVWLLDEAGEKVRNLYAMEDSSSEEVNDGGRVTGVIIKGYAPELASAYNPLNGELVLGYMGAPRIGMYDLEGRELNHIKLPLMQRDVEAADRKEFNELPWIKNSSFFRTAFADKMTFFNRILPVGKNRFLVYNESPFYHNIEGICVDREGLVIKRIHYQCGENGGLMGFRGRILSVRTDEDGAFILEEVIVTP